MGRRLLTTEQAVQATGVKAGTLRQWANRGYLTNYGDGYRAMWDLTELDKRLHRQRVA